MTGLFRQLRGHSSRPAAPPTVALSILMLGAGISRFACGPP